MLEHVRVLVIKQQCRKLEVNEIKQVAKGREERRETKGTEQIINREMKRKTEKDHSGPGFMTPPKYLKKVLPYFHQSTRYLETDCQIWWYKLNLQK